ncbi:MAG: hypothetical protein Q9M18_00470 [Mariprofundaceae bacterium]|nr:hypothetical protein [Mariprofundaceae bacterium]
MSQQHLPFVIHDLQDSQMFALAQAAGRAGFGVQGLASSNEPWIEASRYVDGCTLIPSLGHVIESVYALNLKKSGVSGVWLPCVDDIAMFTREFHYFLQDLGLLHLIASSKSIEQSDLSCLQDFDGFLHIPETHWLAWNDLQAAAEQMPYPLILKSSRGQFQTFTTPQAFAHYLNQHDASPLLQRIQHYIEGETSRMATAMLLFDQHGNIVRGFTGRRLAVEETQHGHFGETIVAKAEWIPELYAGAVELLEHIAWQGFAEVECKQAEDGTWYVLEINPRLSGWLCLAEADGAGFLQAYHALCTRDVTLQAACLQRSSCEYIRLVTAGFHQPHWETPRHPIKTIACLFKDMYQVWRGFPQFIGGAIDPLDKHASIAIVWQNIKHVFKL